MGDKLSLIVARQPDCLETAFLMGFTLALSIRVARETNTFLETKFRRLKKSLAKSGSVLLWHHMLVVNLD